MKTRTLLLLAVTCGLAILLAGGVQLWRLANQTTETVLAMGATGTAGDARVTVKDFTEASGVVTVTVVLAGVDDPEGLDGFTLVGPGKTVSPNQRGEGVCTAFTVAPATCTLTFGVADLKAGNRLLVFQRAAQTVRWKLV